MHVACLEILYQMVGFPYVFSFLKFPNPHPNKKEKESPFFFMLWIKPFLVHQGTIWSQKKVLYGTLNILLRTLS